MLDGKWKRWDDKDVETKMHTVRRMEIEMNYGCLHLKRCFTVLDASCKYISSTKSIVPGVIVLLLLRGKMLALHVQLLNI